MDQSFYKNYFEIEKSHWLMQVRRGIVTDALTRYGSGAGSKVLDFGCGSGYQAARLAEAGYVTHGVDVSQEAIRFGQAQGTKNLRVIDSHVLDYEDNVFDAVLILDVLEHLEDEAWAVREIERVLKPGGIAIIMVPAFPFLWGVQDEVAHHYRRHTMPSIVASIERSSRLTVVKKSYYNTFLFAPIAAVRLVSRWLHLKGRQSDFDLNNRFLNTLCFSIFNAERRLLRRFSFPFGVSILLVVRKPSAEGQ